MKTLALAACLLALACERTPDAVETPTPAAPASRIERDTDADNLLNLAYGASVVSRTGELNLENSAAHAIDSIGSSAWISSPGAPDETVVYSLLAPSRLTRLGLTAAQGDQVPRRIAFDASMDGKAWRELLSVEPQNHNDRQLWPVAETVARYIRVRSLEKEKYYVRVRIVHALGNEVAPPETPSFTGCWTINGERANLVQQGARITGTIESDPPVHVDGGTDNRVALLIWQHGPAWGHAALTRTPDGRHLTGLRFFTDFDLKWLGDAWFGERCGEVERRGFSPPGISREPGGLKPRRSTVPLYGLAFDGNGRLIEELSAPQLDAIVPLLKTGRARIVSHEVRLDTAAENRKQTDARIASLRAALQARGVDLSRIELVSAGSDWNGPVLHSTVQRLFASRVELSFGT